MGMEMRMKTGMHGDEDRDGNGDDEEDKDTC